MKTSTIAIGGIAGVLAILAMLVTYPAVAATQTPTPTIQQASSQLKGNQQLSNLLNQQNLNTATSKAPDKITFTSGQTITLTSTAGGYFVIGDRAQNGTASGTLSLKVDGVLKGGYVVSVTGGSIAIGATTYTVSGGSAEIGPFGRNIVGQGTTSSGFFLFHDRSIGKFGAISYGILTFDLSNGSTEYAVRLLVTVATA
jgi:hypothetical protein